MMGDLVGEADATQGVLSPIDDFTTFNAHESIRVEVLNEWRLSLERRELKRLCLAHLDKAQLTLFPDLPCRSLPYSMPSFDGVDPKKAEELD
jgi:hypothetical protein